jgi:hypothetical protein
MNSEELLRGLMSDRRIKCLTLAQEVVLRTDRLGAERVYVPFGEEAPAKPPVPSYDIAALIIRIAKSYEAYLGGEG